MIGVIVPVYNVEKYLARCIDSILNQTYRDFRIILVDDGSTDNSGLICDEYNDKYDSISVLHTENCGLSVARNTGIISFLKDEETKWITFIDSDDWIHPRYLELLLDMNIKNNTLISACMFKRVSEETKIDIKDVNADILFSEEYWLSEQSCPRIACAKLFKIDLWQNYRFATGKYHEDEYLIYKVLFSQQSISVLYDTLYFYYINETSITSETWSIKRLDKVQALKEQRDFFKENHYKKAYEQAVRMYLYFLYDAAKKLKEKRYDFRLKVKYKEKLRYELIKYILFDRELGINIEDYCAFSFPIASRFLLKGKSLIKR